MFVDQTSLLLALGFAALALSTTLLVTWLSARTEWFILTWAVGAGVLVVAFAAFSIYAVTSVTVLLWGGNMLLSGSFLIFYGAACLFSDARLPKRQLAIAAGAIFALITTPIALGFDALGALFGNVINAVLLAFTARKFWQGRAEAPSWIYGIVALYGATALSFVPCAVMIYLKGPLVLSAPPSGWAEDLNSIVGLIGLTGIGALSLALNQARVARQHRNEAYSDMLTGLMNRRALFETYGASTVTDGTCLLVFDIDYFKAINDTHGHSAGDDVLRFFASLIKQAARPIDMAARIGGEEFVLVLTNTDARMALGVAETIRLQFSREVMRSAAGAFQSTVSTGLACGPADDGSFDNLMRRADDALYLAKNNGRNQVVKSPVTLAA